MKRLEWQGNQAAQHAFLCDMAPGWSLYQGGFGSGKTWAAARKLLVMHTLNGGKSLVVAPTWADLWRFSVPELQLAAAEWGIDAPLHPQGRGQIRYPHMLVDGRAIILLSGDAPERIAGFEVGLAWIDEGARVKQHASMPMRDAPTQIRARLRSKTSRLLHGMVSTTPEGTDTWTQRDWFDAPLASHRAYVGSTRNNAALPRAYLADMTASLAAELVGQYIDGVAATYTRDRAHPLFDRASDVRSLAYRPGQRILIGADFNVSPMCWVVGQESADARGIEVLDEVVLADYGQVDAAVHALVARGWGPGQGRSWEYLPDLSGKARSTTGDPEITVALATARRLGMEWRCDPHGANPPIDSRINLVSRLICAADGRRSLAVDPRCETLIDDLEKCARGPGGYIPGKNGRRGHILDALGYLAWHLHSPSRTATVANWRL